MHVIQWEDVILHICKKSRNADVEDVGDVASGPTTAQIQALSESQPAGADHQSVESQDIPDDEVTDITPRPPVLKRAIKKEHSHRRYQVRELLIF